MGEQDFCFRLRNSEKARLKVWVEPWGEAYTLEPGDQIEVQVRGPAGMAPPNNMLEIESNEESVKLWGWSGSGITVRPL